MVLAEKYEAPLPHPQILEGYERIVPGSAKDIIEDYKINCEYARQINSEALRATIDKDKRAQYMAFIIAVMLFGLVVYCVYLGQYWLAGSALAVAIASLAKTFLQSK